MQQTKKQNVSDCEMKRLIGLIATISLYGFSVSAFGTIVDLVPFACPDVDNIIHPTDVTGNAGGATQCFGTFDGNDPGPDGEGLTIGSMTFDYIAKIDVLDNGTLDPDSGATAIGLSITGDTAFPDASSGTWSYDSNLFSADAFIIVIKAANTPGWAAYLFEGTSAASDAGSWLVAWNASSGSACEGSFFAPIEPPNCADLSHLSIYAKNGTMVPEPATAALLGLGLIGFGLARRRKIK